MALPETSLRLDQKLTLDEALETLRALLRSDLQFDPDLVTKIDDLLRAQPDEQITIALLRGLIDIQNLFFLHLSPRKAIPASLKTVRCARRSDDKTLLLRALASRASVASEIGDLSTALEAGLEALKIGHDIGDVNCIGICYLNLGVYLREAGRFQAALACNEASIRWLQERDGNVERLGWALNAVADQSLKSGDWRAALEAAQSARRTLDATGPDKELTAISRAVYACILMNEVTALAHLSEFEAARSAVGRFALQRQFMTGLLGTLMKPFMN